MDARAMIIRLKKDHLPNYQSDIELYIRIENLCNMLPEFLKLISPSFLNIITNEFRKVLSANCKSDFSKSLLETENSIVDAITVPLKILSIDKLNYIELAREKTYSLGYLLAGVITYHLAEKIANSLNFQSIWPDLQIVYNLFHIKINLFTESLTRKILCGAYSNPDSPPLFENLSKTIFQLCSNFQDYYFIYRTSAAYDLFNPKKNHVFPEKLKVECTHVANFAKSGVEWVDVGEIFFITPFGIEKEEVLRNDRMVVFGKHRLADVKLYESDLKIQDTCMALYCDTDGYYAIDCSLSHRCMVKLSSWKKYEVSEKMVFKVAQNSYIVVRKTGFFVEDDENRLGAYLDFDFLDGNFFNRGRFEPFKLNTLANGQEKQKFTVGTGNAADFNLVSVNGEISPRHLEFLFTDNKWFIQDLNSKNGTFKLFKNIDQLKSKDFSNRLKLFPNDENYITLKISKYVFYIKQV